MNDCGCNLGEDCGMIKDAEGAEYRGCIQNIEFQERLRISNNDSERKGFSFCLLELYTARAREIENKKRSK
jgi:hypothetical protein